MEVITEFPPIFFLILIGLGIISFGIIVGLVFKKIQDYRRYQHSKNHHLNTDIDKIENALTRILYHVENAEKLCMLYSHNGNERNSIIINKMELEIQSIRGFVKHQLGHIPRMRCNLK